MSMQPQEMFIWEGMELLCHQREYQQGKPVNGGVYVVERWDNSRVIVRLHEDYRPRLEEGVRDFENVEDLKQEYETDSETDEEFEGIKFFLQRRKPSHRIQRRWGVTGSLTNRRR